ncbi:hypothetical protein [Sporomusa malonica]|uniref:Uncharacterized protein n=1 Tax=Sporomusa malonica TaxID=112901 RepID=A0A1W2DW38_9FIRM|nr:hypothetical protein [Sporomusa malonica]SMD01659.1 hypothetical protein SAMN04488500_118117 [Sporomusa malonica]
MRTKLDNGKAVILFHRSYRKLPGSVATFLLQFGCFAVPLAALTAYFYPQITRAICLITEITLAPFFQDTITIAETNFIDVVGYIYFIDLPGKFPEFFFSLGNALVCLVLLLFQVYLCRANPLNIFFMMIVAVQLLSSTFFVVAPGLFPYDITDYSYLYMVQQISILFFVPLIMGFALLPLPSSLISKCLTMGITCVYALVFGTVRYAVFLFILAKASLLYMAVLFFVLGPLIDFAYIVGIYSIHVTRLTAKTKEDVSVWRW